MCSVTHDFRFGAYSLRLAWPLCPSLFPYTSLFRSHEILLGHYGTDIGRLSLAYVTRKSYRSYATSMFLNSSLRDRKSTRLNSSHVAISCAVFCLKQIQCAITI